MLIDVKGKNLDGMREKIRQEVKGAICQVPGLKITPEEIYFQFGPPLSCRPVSLDQEKTIKIMVILDPYPCLEEIDNVDSDMIKAAVRLAAERVADNHEVTVFLRCSRSCVGDCCWE